MAEKIEALSPDEVEIITRLVEHFEKRHQEAFIRDKISRAEEDIAAGRVHSHEEVVTFFREKSAIARAQ